jgi:nitrogen fixation protein FixH
MSQLNPASTHDAKPRGLYRLPPQLLWPGLVVALLVGQIVVCFVMISRAVGDPTVAIEPNYYQKAVNWDDSRAARAASAALGWSASWEVAPVADVLGERLVKLSLQDEAGAPITDAAVALRFFHHARSAERFEASLAHGGGGIYAAAVPMKRPGLWTLEVRATHGDDTFLDVSQIKVPQPPRSRP